MSASPSPANPGQPRRPPTAAATARPPPTSTLRRLTPTLLATGTAVTALYAYYSSRPAPAPNPFRTPGVKNIERAYRGAGATGTHTPGYGGTMQGDRDGESFKGDGEGQSPGHGGIGKGGEGDGDGRSGSPMVQSGGKREFNVSGPNEDNEEGPGGKSRDVGEIQRPASGQGSGVGKMWNRAKYGNEDQK